MSETSFTYFPLLPSEIRCQIWQSAINQPRLICINIQNRIPQSPSRRKKAAEREIEQCYVASTLSPCSEFLHTSRESRFQALAVYTCLRPLVHAYRNERRTMYFNNGVDILWLVSNPKEFENPYAPSPPLFPHDLLNTFRGGQMRAHAVAIDWSEWSYTRDEISDVIHFLKGIERVGIRLIYLIVGDDNGDQMCRERLCAGLIEPQMNVDEANDLYHARSSSHRREISGNSAKKRLFSRPDEKALREAGANGWTKLSHRIEGLLQEDLKTYQELLAKCASDTENDHATRNEMEAQFGDPLPDASEFWVPEFSFVQVATVQPANRLPKHDKDDWEMFAT